MSLFGGFLLATVFAVGVVTIAVYLWRGVVLLYSAYEAVKDYRTAKSLSEDLAYERSRSEGLRREIMEKNDRIAELEHRLAGQPYR